MIKTDMDSLSSSPDLHIASGETLVATLHTHPRAIISDRSAPSYGDIDALKLSLFQNFILFVECGNVRYALVISDVSKALNFFKNNSFVKIANTINDVTMKQPDWYSNWQHATQIGVSTALGSASISGISFYISNNSDKTLYTQRNP